MLFRNTNALFVLTSIISFFKLSKKSQIIS